MSFKQIDANTFDDVAIKVLLSFSPDGKTLVYTELNPKTNYDLWALPLEGEREPRPVLQMFAVWQCTSLLGRTR